MLKDKIQIQQITLYKNQERFLQQMKNLSILVLIVSLLVANALCIFPKPKSQQFSQTQYLEVKNVCNIRHIISSDQQSQKVIKVFNEAQVDSKYYLNKILKRVNNNLACSNDVVIQRQTVSNSFIDIKVQIEPKKVDNKQGYVLQISQHSPHIKITIQSYSGYVYALQSLSQLLKQGQNNNNRIPIGIVQDSPIVSYRGVMIDSARHFLKVSTISRLIQSMPLVKLNILHWNLSDDQSFLIELNSHPQFARQTAFKHGQFYTIEQVKQLLAVAKKNGVSIIPQIYSPGHAMSWGMPQKWKKQNITILCNLFEGQHKLHAQLDISKQIVYQLASQIYKQLDNLFRDAPYIHLSGDEDFQACWALNPAIKQFMTLKNIKTYGQLLAYWVYKMKQSLPLNRPSIFWRSDIVNLNISDKDIIHYYGDQNSIPQILGNSTSKVILSTGEYTEISRGFGDIFQLNHDDPYIIWKNMYKNFKVFPEGVDKSRILGAQLTLWGPLSNDDSLQNNIWMRGAVFAAKVWTDQVMTIKELIKSVVLVQKDLITMGVGPSPLVSEYCQKFTDKCLLS